MVGEAGGVQVGAALQDGVDGGEAEGAAEVAGQIEEAGGVLDPLGRQRAEREHVDRDHAEHQRHPAHRLRQEELAEGPVAGDAGEIEARDGEEARPRAIRSARVDLARQHADDRRGQEHEGAGDEHGLADLSAV